MVRQSSHVAGDVEQQPGGGERDEQRTAAGGEERQRQPGDRHQPGDAADVDDGLHHEPADDAAGQQLWNRSCVAIATCTPAYASTMKPPSTATTPIMPSSSATTAKMKSLCASGRNSPSLFSPRPDAGAGDAALRHGDHRLIGLVAEVVLVGGDVHERREPGLAARAGDDERQRADGTRRRRQPPSAAAVRRR